MIVYFYAPPILTCDRSINVSDIIYLIFERNAKKREKKNWTKQTPSVSVGVNMRILFVLKWNNCLQEFSNLQTVFTENKHLEICIKTNSSTED